MHSIIEQSMSDCILSKNEIPGYNVLKTLKVKHPDNVSIAYLNINSVRNKLDQLIEYLGNTINILMIAETKLDESFPDSQFKISGMKKPYRLDVTSNSGGLLVYIDTNISSKRIFLNSIPKDIQAIVFEIIIKNRRLLMICIYRPPKQNLNYFLECINDIIDRLSDKYTDILITGDFNEEISKEPFKIFIDGNEFKSLIKMNTCFKSKSGRCIDLMLTNKVNSFQFSNSFETGCSDHHLMIYTMLKMKVCKLPPKKIFYRDFSKFDSEKYQNDIKHETISDETNLSKLNYCLESVMDRHAPIKTKIVRGNNQAHMSKDLRKEIMTRSRLKNIYNKSQSLKDLLAYKKQRNYVVSMNRKKKKRFFKNLSIDKNNNSNDFWSYCKPLFSTVAEMDSLFPLRTAL